MFASALAEWALQVYREAENKKKPGAPPLRFETKVDQIRDWLVIRSGFWLSVWLALPFHRVCVEGSRVPGGE